MRSDVLLTIAAAADAAAAAAAAAALTGISFFVLQPRISHTALLYGSFKPPGAVRRMCVSGLLQTLLLRL